jgi:hypothetical protein
MAKQLWYVVKKLDSQQQVGNFHAIMINLKTHKSNFNNKWWTGGDASKTITCATSVWYVTSVQW